VSASLKVRHFKLGQKGFNLNFKKPEDEKIHRNRNPKDFKRKRIRCTLRKLSRKYGVNRNTISNWKQKYGGIEVSDMRRLKIDRRA